MTITNHLSARLKSCPDTKHARSDLDTKRILFRICHYERPAAGREESAFLLLAGKAGPSTRAQSLLSLALARDDKSRNGRFWHS